MTLDQLLMERWFIPENFGRVKAFELQQFFSDASLEGYGHCSYLRLIDEEDKAHCSFVIGNARVAPLKQITVSRLELAAATISAKMS